MPSIKLQVRGLARRYGEVVALAPTDLDVAEGEFLTLLGPSGSGKTTLLNLIAGLAAPDEGRLLLNGADVTHGPPYERDIGMVFQNYALFPHMTVAENIAFPLKMRRVGAAEARTRAEEALAMVRLPQVAQRLPRELSGGQQQRIALARCLVYRPSVILMDEPLGALDKKLRDQMQLEIRRIHRELGTTIVYVTHDQEEAMAMSDRICLMDGGRIAQLGTPADLYFRPASVFVADFVGESNLLDATVLAVEGEDATVEIGGAAGVHGARHAGGLAAGQRVKVMVRPQNLAVAAGQGGQGPAAGLRGWVVDCTITGSLTKLYVRPDAPGLEPVVAAYPTAARSPRLAAGDAVTLHWQAVDAFAVAH